MGIFGFGNREAAFWSWFVKNEATLFEATNPDAPAFVELSKRLRKVQKDLTYEVSVQARAGVRELIISADGVRSAFFAVEKLADAAPQLPRWKVIRFRPRMLNYATVQLAMNGQSVSAEDLEYQLLVARDKSAVGRSLGIRLFVRGCETEDDPQFTHIAFLMLDTALGEYDMETKVSLVEVRPWSEQTEAPRDKFANLVEDFDRAFEAHCCAESTADE